MVEGWACGEYCAPQHLGFLTRGAQVSLPVSERSGGLDEPRCGTGQSTDPQTVREALSPAQRSSNQGLLQLDGRAGLGRTDPAEDTQCASTLVCQGKRAELRGRGPEPGPLFPEPRAHTQVSLFPRLWSQLQLTPGTDLPILFTWIKLPGIPHLGHTHSPFKAPFRPHLL